MRYVYAKIPVRKAEDSGIAEFRQRTPDGEFVIINESDLQTYGSSAPFEKKVKSLGGKVLTAAEAKEELNR